MKPRHRTPRRPPVPLPALAVLLLAALMLHGCSPASKPEPPRQKVEFIGGEPPEKSEVSLAKDQIEKLLIGRDLYHPEANWKRTVHAMVWSPKYRILGKIKFGPHSGWIVDNGKGPRPMFFSVDRYGNVTSNSNYADEFPELSGKIIHVDYLDKASGKLVKCQQIPVGRWDRTSQRMVFPQIPAAASAKAASPSPGGPAISPANASAMWLFALGVPLSLVFVGRHLLISRTKNKRPLKTLDKYATPWQREEAFFDDAQRRYHRIRSPFEKSPYEKHCNLTKTPMTDWEIQQHRWVTAFWSLFPGSDRDRKDSGFENYLALYYQELFRKSDERIDETSWELDNMQRKRLGKPLLPHPGKPLTDLRTLKLPDLRAEEEATKRKRAEKCIRRDELKKENESLEKVVELNDLYDEIAWFDRYLKKLGESIKEEEEFAAEEALRAEEERVRQEQLAREREKEDYRECLRLAQESLRSVHEYAEEETNDPPEPGPGSILIGERLVSPGTAGATEIVHEDEDSVRYHYLGKLKGIVAEAVPEASFSAGGGYRPETELTLDAETLSRHAFIVGAIGTGKTRLLVQMAVEQLKAGCSVIMVDPKEETLAHVYELALASGFPKERVDLLLPRLGKNTRCCFDPLAGKPATFASVMKGIVGSGWGPRMGDHLVNSLVVMQRLGATCLELFRFFQSEPYREWALEQARGLPGREDDTELEAALEYFDYEFDGLSAGEKMTRAAPILNKLRDFTRNPFLLHATSGHTEGVPLFDAGNYFDLKPDTNRLGLIYLDREELGDDTVKLFAGLVLNHIFFRSMRNTQQNSRPCVLCLDEAAISAPFLGDILMQSIAICRSMNLRVMAACQNLTQLETGLRDVLTSNPAFQAYFRLGFDDARIGADKLSADAKDRVSKVVVGRGKRGRPDLSIRFHLRLKDGTPVKRRNWEAFADAQGKYAYSWEEGQKVFLKARARHVEMHDLDTGSSFPLEWASSCFDLPDAMGFEDLPPEAPPNVRGVSGGDAYLDVPVFKPEVKRTERFSRSDFQKQWLQELSSLPTGTAAAKVVGQGISMVRVARVPDPSHPAALDSHPLPSGSVEGAVRERRQGIIVAEAGLESSRQPLQNPTGGKPTKPTKPTFASKKDSSKKDSDGNENDKSAGGESKYGSADKSDPGL